MSENGEGQVIETEARVIEEAPPEPQPVVKEPAPQQPLDLQQMLTKIAADVEEWKRLRSAVAAKEDQINVTRQALAKMGMHISLDAFDNATSMAVIQQQEQQPVDMVDDSGVSSETFDEPMPGVTQDRRSAAEIQRDAFTGIEPDQQGLQQTARTLENILKKNLSF